RADRGADRASSRRDPRDGADDRPSAALGARVGALARRGPRRSAAGGGAPAPGRARRRARPAWSHPALPPHPAEPRRHDGHHRGDGHPRRQPLAEGAPRARRRRAPAARRPRGAARDRRTRVRVSIALAVRFLHVAAALTWVGGMLFVALVLVPVTRRLEDAMLRRHLMHEAGLRFRTVGWIAMGVLVATGLVNVWQRP